LAQLADSCRRAFQRHQLPRATRQGFEPQRPAAGEAIEHHGTPTIGGQPVEQGFPYSIRRRPQALGIDHGEPAAAPLATDDSDA